MSATWVIIPAYNESQVIASVLRDVKKVFANVVVVDDHSHDSTSDVARNAGAHVCRHPVNLGQGAALQTGIAYALAQGAQVLVTFDADGQHRPEDAARMVDTLIAGDYEVVLSSRFKGGAVGMPAVKRKVLQLATWFTRVTSGLAVTDTHNGLRVMSRAAAERIHIHHNRMAHASEILEEIGRLKLRWTEVPGTVRYTAYSIAKGQRVSGALEILKDLYCRKLRS